MKCLKRVPSLSVPADVISLIYEVPDTLFMGIFSDLLWSGKTNVYC